MSKIEVDHLAQTKPYQLQEMIDLVNEVWPHSHWGSAEPIVVALRNYRGIVLQAYAQSLNDEVEKHELAGHCVHVQGSMPTGKDFEARHLPVFQRGPFGEVES